MISRPLLPVEYKRYIQEHGQFEAFFDGEPGYIQLWSLSELTDINSEVEIDERAPGFLGFASDGGNEIFAFDASGAVFILPMIGMDAQCAIKVADSFSELANNFQTEIQNNITRKN